MDCNFVTIRAERLALSIAGIEDAIDALTIGGVAEYRIDTGQTVQQVTKLDLPRLDMMIDSMLNRLEVLCARCPQTAGQAGTLIAYAVKKNTLHHKNK